MPLIYNKHITATVVGGRFVELICDNCQCDFAYELIRVGKGESDALYGLGQESANTAAVERSHQNLSEQLAVEADLVPCPKCRWINESLVAGYRLGRYQRLFQSALAIAVVEIGVCLIAVWFLAIGPDQDRWLAPYVLFGSIAGGAGLVFVAWVLRNWLRLRIQPNALYPRPPRLPPGTPRVFIKHRITGEYQPAEAPSHDGPASESTITLQFGTWKATNRCCCCLRETPADQKYSSAAFAPQSVAFPYCTDCESRRRWRSRGIAVLALVVTLPMAAGVSWLMGGRGDFAWIFGLGALATLAMCAALGKWLTAPMTCRVLDERRGVVRLWFRNPDFIAAITGKENRLSS